MLGKRATAPTKILENKMDHCWKTLREQMKILGMDQAAAETLDLEFVRVHALAISQICDELLTSQTGFGGQSGRSSGACCRG